MATAGRRCGASRVVRKIAVGPSAPAMIDADAASPGVMPMERASTNTAHMPNCAPAPKNRLDGRARSGPKSVIAPIPKKMSDG